jgi:hypothetical protein
MEGFNLDFLPAGFGFPSEKAWISFRGDLEILHRSGASTMAGEFPPAAIKVARRT